MPTVEYYLESADHHSLIVQCAVGLDKKLLSGLIPASSDELTGGQAPEFEGGEQKKRVREAVTALLQSDVLRPDIKDSIYAEVLHRNRCIGGLVIFSLRQEKAFSDSDFRLLQAIADDIAIAMEREQLAKEADEARALYEAEPSAISIHLLRIP